MDWPGPAQGSRSIPAYEFHDILCREASDAGVTRIADLTGLDRIGFPVWQAVRPLGRAQSVHQGKGGSDLMARIGALGEALESHFAEGVAADRPVGRWQDLPPQERCPDPSDCYSHRNAADPGSIAWCEASDLRERRIYLPHLFVSLDFTLPVDGPFERCSAGLALGTCQDEAVETALLELLERDAVGEWKRLPATKRAASRLSIGSIDFDWFRHWRSRIAAAGANVHAYALEAIEGTPVCMVFLSGPEAFGSSDRLFMGSAAHGSPEIALFKALAEAIQSRLTFIAGTRDDMLPSHYEFQKTGLLLGGAEIGRHRLQFSELSATNTAPLATADRLAKLGFDRVAVKRLSSKTDPFAAVRVFVPGLGSLHRSRREPCAS